MPAELEHYDVSYRTIEKFPPIGLDELQPLITYKPFEGCYIRHFIYPKRKFTTVLRERREYRMGEEAPKRPNPETLEEIAKLRENEFFALTVKPVPDLPAYVVGILHVSDPALV